MNIIIAGCGRVGMTLAETLSDEGHDITLIDTNGKKLTYTTNALDVMAVEGNAGSYSIQLEAGIEDADLFIAVTNSDEMNLLCCLIAKQAGKCSSIARVRNPIYNKEIGFIKSELGISMIINPELAASIEMARILRFPQATQIETFAKGRVEIIKYQIEPGSRLEEIKLAEMSQKLKCDVLICAIERGDEALIPNGDVVLQANDKISVIASPRNLNIFFKNIGVETHQVKNTMIAGGSKIAYYLSRQLLEMGIGVRIIEKDADRAEELSILLPKAVIIHGDATDQDLLLEEDIQHVESFASLTDFDEENIMLSLYVRSVSRAKVLTKIKRFAFEGVIDNLQLGSIISPKDITAEHIIQYVRAKQNSLGSNVETMYRIIGHEVEALEFQVREDSAVVGKKLMNLELRKNLLIGCIHRKGAVIIPRGQDTIEVGDSVVVVTTIKGLDDIKEILKR